MEEVELTFKCRFLSLRRSKQANAGFTLVELMVVVVVIGILTTLAISSYSGAVRKAKLSEARIALKTIWECNQAYYMEHGEYFGPCYDIGTTGVPEIGFSPLSGKPLFVYSIVINSPPVYIAEPLMPNYGGDGSLRGYELQVDVDGNLSIFEPGDEAIGSLARKAPTGGMIATEDYEHVYGIGYGQSGEEGGSGGDTGGEEEEEEGGD